MPHHVLHHVLKENLSSSIWITSCPFFCTDLGVYRTVALTYSHSCLLAAIAQSFFPHFLKYIVPEALPWSLMGLGYFLDPAAPVSVGHKGNFLQLLTEAILVAPPATKTWPCKPNTHASSKSWLSVKQFYHINFSVR